MRCSFLLLLTLLTGCGPGRSTVSTPTEAWDGANQPTHLPSAYGGSYETRFDRLPLSGQASSIPWSDTFWPSKKGGLAYRWQEPQTDPWRHPLPTQPQVYGYSYSQLKTLSPAEKFDIFVGRYDYPLTNAERQRTSPTDEAWAGLCHGWAPAAIGYREPKPVTLTGVNGVKMPFGSSDIKALLTFWQQYQRTAAETPMVGQRCDWDLAKHPEHQNDAECRDNNAGAFHILMANQLGLAKQALVVDITRDLEIWNQPVYGFATQVVGTSQVYQSAAPGTVKVVKVRTAMKYVIENGPYWNPVPPSQYPQELTQNVYEYTLELDAAGRIIGGEWLGYGRPDFAWVQRTHPFDGYFDRLQLIYDAATASEDNALAAVSAVDEASRTPAEGEVGETAWLPTDGAPAPGR